MIKISLDKREKFDIFSETKGIKMKDEIIFSVIILVSVLVVGFLLVGPAGCENKFSSWKASAYGSDWLVVQYAQDGSVITHWELKDAAVNNEKDSDGIYFTTPNGVVHLSGHYVYVQSPNQGMYNRLLKLE